MKNNLLKRSVFVLVVFVVAFSSACTTPTTVPATAVPATAVPATAVPATEVSATEVPATEVPPADEAITLKIWVTGAEFDAGLMQAAADLYNESHPNVTFEIEPVAWGDAHTKIVAATAAQEGPDIITGGMSWGIELGKQGGMIDLKAKYPEIVADIEAKSMPGIWSAVVPPSGEVYGPEWAPTLLLPYYRTDVIKELTGSEALPQTWEELTALLDKAVEAGMTNPAIVQWGSTNWMGYFNFLYAGGGSFYSADCSEVTINSPEAEVALQYFIDFYSKYGSSTEGWPGDTGWVDGEAVVIFTGNWSIPGYDLGKPELAGKWVPAAFPVGPSGKRTSFLGGSIVGIMSYAKPEVQDVAADFIHFLYSEEAVKAEGDYAITQKNIYIPPSTEFVDLISTNATYQDAIKTILDDAAGPPNCPGWEQGNPAVDKNIQEIIFNNMTIPDALAAMEKELIAQAGQ